MSDNSDTVYNAPANLKSKVWKRFGYFKKEGHLDENYTGDEESVDANVSNVTASTSKNMQDNNMAIKDFFQPQLRHASNRSVFKMCHPWIIS